MKGCALISCGIYHGYLRISLCLHATDVIFVLMSRIPALYPMAKAQDIDRREISCAYATRYNANIHGIGTNTL